MTHGWMIYRCREGWCVTRHPVGSVPSDGLKEQFAFSTVRDLVKWLTVTLAVHNGGKVPLP